MSLAKKEIDTNYIKKIYYRGLQKITTSHNKNKRDVAAVRYSLTPIIYSLKEAQESLADLKRSYSLNKFNEDFLNAQIGKLMNFEKILRDQEAEIKKHQDAINDLIIEFNKFVNLNNSKINDSLPD